VRSNLLLEERRRRNVRRAVAAGLVLAAVAGAVVAGPRALEAFAPVPPVATQDAVAKAAPVVKPAEEDAPARREPASALRTRPLSAWLGDIAREAGRDLVLSPELRGDLTASESVKLDWKERLEAYARVSGFDYALSDGLIEARRGGEDASSAGASRVRTTTVSATEVTGTTLPATSEPAREGGASPAATTKDAAAKDPHAPLPETRVLRLAHAPAKETAAVLAKSGDALDVSVSADSASNSLVITGSQPGLGRVLKVLGDLDRPRRRIHLEAKIVEVTRSARLDLGVEWKLTGTTVGGDVKFPPNVSDAGSAALVIATKGAAMLDARISALEADGRLHVVSRPSVEMLEGSPATIESVRILRIRLPSNGTVVGDEVVAAPSSGRATEDIPVGVRLEVTPAIRGGTRVLLRIRAKSSNLGAPLPPDDIPEELSRMVDAEVLVGDGETAVLGGLMREAGQNSDAGVPGLRRAPLFGGLFGKKSKVGAEEELLVLVTPRVLD
jgi:type II secretory pathway component GspD/PulD (secretin)